MDGNLASRPVLEMKLAFGERSRRGIYQGIKTVVTERVLITKYNACTGVNRIFLNTRVTIRAASRS